MDDNKTSSPSQLTEKQQVVDAIKNGSNVLITVSQNPSVDQLATCIGLTLLLNKIDKHATAVFSGAIPPAINFLQPEKTLETNTNSLRDFIIALDRSKADKLRYKVEDNFVRIFITPYRTSINETDLVFSQGDFNVDVVIALGVDQREHLDMAIMENGRILHDAVVIGMSCGQTPTNVGSLNWHDSNASSLAEMIVSISESFKSGVIDGQMATAFLTGIVAETDRFRNEKTSPKTMTMSAQLMAAGANQQLIASELSVAQSSGPLKEEASNVIDVKENSEKDEPVSEPLAVNTEIKINPVSDHEDQEESHSESEPSINLMDNLNGDGEEAENNIRRIKIDAEGKLHEDNVVNSNQTDSTLTEPTQGYINNGAHKVIQPLPTQNQATDELNPYFSEKPTNDGNFTSVSSAQATDFAPNPLATNLPTPTGILSHENDGQTASLVSVESAGPQVPSESSADSQLPAGEPQIPPVPEQEPGNNASLDQSVNDQFNETASQDYTNESPPQFNEASLPNSQANQMSTGYMDESTQQTNPEAILPPAVPTGISDSVPSPVVDASGQVSNYVETPSSDTVDPESARKAVLEALAANPSSAPSFPVEALNAQPLHLSNQPPQALNQMPINPNPPPVVPPPIPFNNSEAQTNPNDGSNELPPSSNNPFNLPPVQN